jgi:hypothetical protein
MRNDNSTKPASQKVVAVAVIFFFCLYFFQSLSFSCTIFGHNLICWSAEKFSPTDFGWLKKFEFKYLIEENHFSACNFVKNNSATATVSVDRRRLLLSLNDSSSKFCYKFNSVDRSRAFSASMISSIKFYNPLILLIEEHVCLPPNFLVLRHYLQ